MCPDVLFRNDTEQNKRPFHAADTTAKTGIIDDHQAGIAGRHDDGAAPANLGPDGPAARLTGGFKSSDADLAKLAAAALERNAPVLSGKVRPVVRNAWLILEGEVAVLAERHAAEDAVKGLPGIRGVSNDILIESEVMARRVSRKIDEAFIRDARLNASRISVTACDHKIILSGSVRSGQGRAEAEAAAWGVRGVTQVVNRIRAT